MSRKRSKNRPQPAAHAAAPAWPWLLWLKALVIVAAGAYVLSPALHGDWYADDDYYLRNNPLLNDPNRLWKAWFQPGSFIEYYPVDQTVQWWQYLLWGNQDPFPYHVCNLVLHLTSALLLWRLLGKLGLKLAWLGGLIYAIHPFATDSVGVACELKNTLAVPPFLLAMILYLDFEQSRQPRHYLLALTMFTIAMFCKITMYFFPFVILLYAWWKRGRVTLDDARAALPFFLVSLVLGCLTVHAGAVYADTTHYQSPGPIHLGGIPERIELAGLSLAFYFGHWFLPIRQMPFFPLWELDPVRPALFVPWLGIAFVLGVCWMKRHTWGRPALFGLSFFALGMAPFLGLNQVSYMCLGWVWEHMTYLPMIGLIGLVVAGIEHLGRQLPAKFLYPGIAVLALTLVLLGRETYSYGKLFVDREQLWRYNLKYVPNMWALHQLLAEALSKKGAYDESIEESRETLRMNPEFCNGWMQLALCLERIGKNAEAIPAIEHALRIDPHMEMARLLYGDFLVEAGRPGEAITQFNLILPTRADSSELHIGYGYAYAAENRYADAAREFKIALKIEHGNPAIQKLVDQATRSAEMQAGR